MKKLCILVCMTLPLCGLVWSEDQKLTERQKKERREINRRISENIREMKKEKGNEQEKDGENYSKVYRRLVTPGHSSPSSVFAGHTEDFD